VTEAHAKTAPKKARDSGPPSTLLGHKAYEAILDAISTFQLSPGQAVSVGSLSEWLKMSRTPVRDALQRLQHDGLIRSLPRRGLVITQLSPQGAEELFELQEALEATAAKLAAERATAEQRHRLQVIARKMLGVAGDVKKWIEIDASYHALLLESAHSAAIHRAAKTLAPQLQRFRALVVLNTSRPTNSAREHVATTQAIVKGDCDKAVKLTHEHWARARKEAVENLQRYAQLGGILAAGGRPSFG
jgi:DNA-binding GntR family transcriptional regulator